MFANDPQTGGMTNLCVGTDPYGMNFVHPANGKDFPSSLGPRFRWGLGSVKVDGRPCAWEKPASAEGDRLIYRPAELLARPWYCEVSMCKYVAMLIDCLHKDQTISALLDPVQKIQSFVEKAVADGILKV